MNPPSPTSCHAETICSCRPPSRSMSRSLELRSWMPSTVKKLLEH
uniref:Uncharacterized protein n=1 Tax=Anguilla anguilla TaxID=7936 RepID=A0A0E9SS87_ANGAN